jgi:hypothetical protein
MSNAVNASRRDGTPVCLRLLSNSGQLIIEVWDRSPARPELRQAGCWEDHGRGLSIVDAVSHRWGWHHTDGWKVVWCELLTTPAMVAALYMAGLAARGPSRQHAPRVLRR